MKKILFLILFTLFSTIVSFGQNIAELKQKAEQGDVEAQFRLGRYYHDYNTRNYTEAVNWFRKAAEQGNAGAQYYLGICYVNGEGVKENKSEAVKWYRKAALQGNASAQYSLGNHYAMGYGIAKNKVIGYAWFLLSSANVHERDVAIEGMEDLKSQMTPIQIEKALILAENYYKRIFYKIVEEDLDEDLRLYRKTALQTLAEAQLNLGLFYAYEDINPNRVRGYAWVALSSANGNKKANQYMKRLEKYMHSSQIKEALKLAENYSNEKIDENVEENLGELFKQYRKSAEQGDPEAQFNLGYCYLKGYGVEEDAKEAVNWFHKSATQGYAKAQVYLSAAYYSGLGVIQNKVKAYAWNILASKNGDENAKRNVKFLSEKMTPDQIKEALELAEKYDKGRFD